VGSEYCIKSAFISGPNALLQLPLASVVRFQVGWLSGAVSVLLMNMSNSDSSSARLSADDWERIARYVTGEAARGEAQITQRWVEADAHRMEIVRLLESIVRNVDREDSSAGGIQPATSQRMDSLYSANADHAAWRDPLVA